MYTTEMFLDGQNKMIALQNSESCSGSESKVLGETQLKCNLSLRCAI